MPKFLPYGLAPDYPQSPGAHQKVRGVPCFRGGKEFITEETYEENDHGRSEQRFPADLKGSDSLAGSMDKTLFNGCPHLLAPDIGNADFPVTGHCVKKVPEFHPLFPAQWAFMQVRFCFSPQFRRILPVVVSDQPGLDFAAFHGDLLFSVP
jgi:hypothetical protein